MKSGKNNKHKNLEASGNNIDLPTLLNALCDEINYRESDIIGLKNSLSWKITSPCRFIDELLRKVRFESKKVKTDKIIPFRSDSSQLINLAKSYLNIHYNKIILNSNVVCFDVSVLVNNDAGTGIQRVVREIATNIAKLENENYILVDFSKDFPVDVTSHFKSETKADYDRKIQLEYGKIVLLDSTWDLFKKKPNFLKDAKKAGVKITTVIYDIFPLTNPELCAVNTVDAYTHWFNNIIGITDSFLCISQATMVSLNDFFKASTSRLSADKITYNYWHLGSDFNSNQAVNSTHTIIPFLLMVSTVEPRKNYEFVIDAISKMWVDGELDHRLVIVGRPGWNYQDVLKKIVDHPEYNKKLIWHENGISDSELATLYSGSSALIQASINEGFGLAVVEASNYKKPIVLSDIPVFREIILDNGYFFDLGSISSFERAINSATRPNASPTTTIQTSWEKSTSEFLKIAIKNCDY